MNRKRKIENDNLPILGGEDEKTDTTQYESDSGSEHYWSQHEKPDLNLSDDEQQELDDVLGRILPPSRGSQRRASVSGLPVPAQAVVAEGGRIVPQRRRSNSLPTTIAPAEPEDRDVRHVIFSPSPLRRDTRFVPGSRALATFQGERVLCAPDEDFDDRASIASLEEKYEAKRAHAPKKRGKWSQGLFRCAVYLLLICFTYFVLIGRPLWNGLVYDTWYVMKYLLVVEAGCAIFISVAFGYAIGTLLVRYEPDPEPIPRERLEAFIENNSQTALIIPCYKASAMIGDTVRAALKVFPPQNIYVVANGNSPTPLDDTEEVVRPYGVNHIWVPIGSKIVAQFVGVYAAYKFQYILFIDDDCILPPAFPIVSDRIQPGTKGGLVKCVGYTIKAVGPNGTKGNNVQQLQDLEYKLSGMARKWQGTWGTATFPHGAIALWERDFILKCFRVHPGFKISEDWFFGYVCRTLGGRIVMCTSVLVETEVPSGLFKGAGSRGGFGEMTVYKQRFFRWNFFYLFRMYHNLRHIFFDWKMGIYDIGSKVYTFQEVLATFLYVSTPIVLPIAFLIRPSFVSIMTGAVIGMYYVIVILFNEIILRKKKEMVSRKIVFFYYIPYKFVLRIMNVASIYYSAYKYAEYFMVRHPRVIDDDKAVEFVLHSRPSRRPRSGPSASANAARSRPPSRRQSIFRKLSFCSSKKVEPANTA